MKNMKKNLDLGILYLLIGNHHMSYFQFWKIN